MAMFNAFGKCTCAGLIVTLRAAFSNAGNGACKSSANRFCG